MNEDPTKRPSDGESFEARVLSGLAAIQVVQVEIRNEQIEIRREQAEMRKAIAALDSRLGSVEKRLSSVEERFSSVEERLSSVEERFSSVEERLTSLEEKVDARLRETRPIWESVLDNVKRLDLKFDELLSELFEVKADSKRHERLILQLEKLR
ncbi:MAG TPA: hypothetical protein VN937_05535 [Blastocatellia bacterium]|nr:hypothetical protein [Blastocatellia bacterium]